MKSHAAFIRPASRRARGLAAATRAGAAVALLAASTAGAAPPGLSPFVSRALDRALSVPDARIDEAAEDKSASWRSGCRAADAEVARPIEASARVAVKLRGQKRGGEPCEEWTWVRVRVVAPVAVAARALAPGERIEGAVSVEERELRPGHAPASIGSATVAAHALAAGQMIEAAVVVEPMVRPGESVKVLVVSGSLTIEQAGRGVPCARGRSCAKLDSGKQVEGDLVAGKLVVQSQ
jgi:hypothetical protein